MLKQIAYGKSQFLAGENIFGVVGKAHSMAYRGAKGWKNHIVALDSGVKLFRL
jgi:hypothetical protein